MAVKWDINIGTLVPIGMALLGGAFWINTQLTGMDLRMHQTESNITELTAGVKAVQDSSIKQSNDLNNLTYRMGQTESAIGSANQRMDRIADSVLASVDSIKKDIGALTTKFEVMSQKFDNLDVPRNKR